MRVPWAALAVGAAPQVAAPFRSQEPSPKRSQAVSLPHCTDSAGRDPRDWAAVCDQGEAGF